LGANALRPISVRFGGYSMADSPPSTREESDGSQGVYPSEERLLVLRRPGALADTSDGLIKSRTRRRWRGCGQPWEEAVIGVFWLEMMGTTEPSSSRLRTNQRTIFAGWLPHDPGIRSLAIRRKLSDQRLG